jgi:hypothetical protein
MGRLNTTMYCQGGGGGGGNPGGSGGGGGGGSGGEGLAPAPPATNPTALVTPATDVRSMGTLPAIFTSDRTKVQDFLDELRSYFRANQGVAGFNSFIWEVSITLTLIKGPAVAGWTCSMGDWIDSLDPLQDDYKIVWTQFQQKFHNQFTDSQQPQCTCIKLNNLKMRFPDIDQYITKFEDLVWLAGYTVGNEETINLFLHGLTPSILDDVVQPPFVNGYIRIKERAIQLTKARQMTKAIKAWREIGNQCPFQRPQGFQNFFGNTQQHPQYMNQRNTLTERHWSSQQGRSNRREGSAALEASRHFSDT